MNNRFIVYDDINTQYADDAEVDGFECSGCGERRVHLLVLHDAIGNGVVLCLTCGTFTELDEAEESDD